MEFTQWLLVLHFFWRNPTVLANIIGYTSLVTLAAPPVCSFLFEKNGSVDQVVSWLCHQWWYPGDWIYMAFVAVAVAVGAVALFCR